MRRRRAARYLRRRARARPHSPWASFAARPGVTGSRAPPAPPAPVVDIRMAHARAPAAAAAWSALAAETSRCPAPPPSGRENDKLRGEADDLRRAAQPGGVSCLLAAADEMDDGVSTAALTPADRVISITRPAETPSSISDCPTPTQTQSQTPAASAAGARPAAWSGASTATMTPALSMRQPASLARETWRRRHGHAASARLPNIAVVVAPARCRHQRRRRKVLRAPSGAGRGLSVATIEAVDPG